MSQWFIKLDGDSVVESWGDGRVAKFFPEDLLGGCFERTLEVERFEESEIDWVFTGARAGITLRVGAGGITITHRYYDSPGYAELVGLKHAHRHIEYASHAMTIEDSGRFERVTVRLDATLTLVVLADDREVHRRLWAADLSRHQICLTQVGGVFAGRLSSPEPRPVTVKVLPRETHQSIIGFGGTAAPAAYALLSDEGRRQWWRLVSEYNLLIQREYPVGRQLRIEMNNWDWPESATPHYYGDNFPNSEVSDFDYVRKIRSLGGQVWFEFWHLPVWAEDDADKFAQAVVAYCDASQVKAGAPPDVVGIQNEVGQTNEMWQQMTLCLRRRLDDAGFGAVKIHMSDDGHLLGAVRRAKAVQELPEAWKATAYSASHSYDYQNNLRNPDAFDATFATFKAATEGKPFLATEVCLNSAEYQHDSYRVALSMAQLYHKNLVLGDAVALCYCWTLLNVVQSSYGATRSLCVPDEANGFVPRASSHQLRVFGAFSRHVRRGMVRVTAESKDPDVLACAFAGGGVGGASTLVAVNRAVWPVDLKVDWPGATFATMERVDPYHPNSAGPAPSGCIRIPAGGIVTLTSAPAA